MTSGCWAAGEERRAYGVILLSMADVPVRPRPPAPPPWPTAGATSRPASRLSPASGATPPDGPGLGLCGRGAAPHLPGGYRRAAEMPGGTDRGALALAQAQLNRPTTVAGALDTYAS